MADAAGVIACEQQWHAADVQQHAARVARQLTKPPILRISPQKMRRNKANPQRAPSALKGRAGNSRRKGRREKEGWATKTIKNRRVCRQQTGVDDAAVAKSRGKKRGKIRAYAEGEGESTGGAHGARALQGRRAAINSAPRTWSPQREAINNRQSSPKSVRV